MSKKIIIFDLDGTLANIEHRRHFVTDPNYGYSGPPGTIVDGKIVRANWKPDWDSFYKACVDDTVNDSVLRVYEALFRIPEYLERADYVIEIWSGREESVRKETVTWINKHMRCGGLKMRPVGDYTPDEELKEKWLMEVGVENVLMVFDDRDKVVKMWRRHGVPCFQVAEGNF